MAIITPVKAQACPCGGKLGLRYNEQTTVFTAWHEPPWPEQDTDFYTLGWDEFAARGGGSRTRAIVADWATSRHLASFPLVRAALLVLDEAAYEAVMRQRPEGAGRREDTVVSAGGYPPRDPRGWPGIKDKSVCVTGTLAGYSRQGIAREIARLGGYHDDKVTRSTDLLVVAARPGAVKRQDARAYGVPELGERDFLALLARARASSAARESGKTTAPPPVTPGALPRVGDLVLADDGVAVGAVVAIGRRVDGDTVLTVEGGGRTYTIPVAELAPRTTPAARAAPQQPAAPVRRAPTAEELLRRERYVRGERG